MLHHVHLALASKSFLYASIYQSGYASFFSNHLIDYLIFLTYRTNCVGNPYCLNGLGEKKLINLINKEPSVPLARDNYLRNLVEYAGLVNLGATCYINTYLQVSSFRQVAH